MLLDPLQMTICYAVELGLQNDIKRVKICLQQVQRIQGVHEHQEHQ